MPKALYYPHTSIKNETVLKNALLLWDSVQTIVPSSMNGINDVHDDRNFQEATELIVQPRQPTEQERSAADSVLQKMTDSGQLAMLLAKTGDRFQRDQIHIYEEKFLYRTWEMLREGNLAYLNRPRGQYRVPPALGYLMMSLLADSCAGTQIQKITDRVEAYSWLAEAHAQVIGATPVNGLDVSQVAPAYDRLVAISLNVLDARSISLKNLLEFRKREARSGTSDYRAMRKRYFTTLSAHIKRVSSEAKNAKDMIELEQQFRDELQQDLADLKSELKATSLKTLFSKDVALSVLISAGTLVSPIAGLTTLATEVGGLSGIIPLAKSAIELRGARRTALLKHTSSWLYLAKSPRFQSM